jgi:hypothetical protein
MSSKLESAVHEWLARVVTSESPASGVIAYNVGLFETESGYSAYLLGAAEYDEDDSDWACEEAFTPQEKYSELPSSKFKLGSWEKVQEMMVAAVRKALDAPELQKSFLGRSKAVTVGFDDGDLERVK